MNKLEKVALRFAKRTGKPLVLVLNNVHLFNSDDEGRNMLLQLQQRGESWAASGECGFALRRGYSCKTSGRHINTCDELVSHSSFISVVSCPYLRFRDDFWPYTVLRTSLSEVTVSAFHLISSPGRNASRMHVNRFCQFGRSC